MLDAPGPSDHMSPDEVQELLFHRAADSALDGVAIVDFDFRFVYVNEARARMHGCTVEELVGKPVTMIGADPEQVAHIATHVRDVGHWQGEIQAVRKDGSRFPVRQTISRVDDENGQPIAMLSITRDVSAEKSAAEHIRRRSRQLASLLEASRHINAALDIAGVMRLLVEHGMSLTGASGGFAGLVADDTMLIREYHRLGSVVPVDYRFRSGYGVPGWVMEHRTYYLTNDAANDPQVTAHIRREHDIHKLINVPIVGSDGELLGCIEVTNESHEKEFASEDADLLVGLANQAAVALRNAMLAEDLSESAERLRKSEETLRLVVEGSPDFFFYIHDDRGVFTYVSPSVEMITGRTTEEWKTHYTRFLTDSPINDRVIEYTEKTLLTGEITPSYPVEILHKDGKRIELEIYERPIFEEHKIVGIRGVARDVTDLRRAEAAERAVREESERMRRTFYRDTILSVTDGRLVICDGPDAEELACEPVFPPIRVAEPRDVSMVRDEVRQVAQRAGMGPNQIGDLVLCVGEAATNSLKHAGGGMVCVADYPDSIHVRVSDTGPGMDSLALPKLTLLRGFSTKRSLGMGYAAILALSDKVFLSTGPAGTSVAIVKLKEPVTADVRLEDLPDLW